MSLSLFPPSLPPFRINVPTGMLYEELAWWRLYQEGLILGQSQEPNEVDMIIQPVQTLRANACIGKIYCDVLSPDIVQNASFVLNTFLGFQIPLYLDFSYLTNVFDGQTQNKDQYAMYYVIYLQGTTTGVLNITSVDVSFVNKANYVSFLSGVRKGTMANTDIDYASNCMASDVVFADGDIYIPNPYMPGNKSPQCYPPAVTFHGYPTPNPLEADSWDVGLPNPINPTTGEVYVYRVDKLNSETRFAGEEPNKGCLTTYLFSTFLTTLADCGTIDEGFLQYGVMRIKVPNTYDSTMPCGDMGSYDALYYSVSSHQCKGTSSDGLLPFWTVNARMMKNTPSDDGYVYVFWAPVADAREIKRQQSTNPGDNYWEPPIIEWGGRRGYLLGLPTLAFFFRYKAPDTSWEGWPGNAPCYDTPDQNQPITDQLGDWCPELYGQTFASYDAFINAPSIGVVPRDGPWPASPS